MNSLSVFGKFSANKEVKISRKQFKLKQLVAIKLKLAVNFGLPEGWKSDEIEREDLT